MNRDSNTPGRKVRFDSSTMLSSMDSVRLTGYCPPQVAYTNFLEGTDEATHISQRILELSRLRRKNQRMILLEVANIQEKMASSSSLILKSSDQINENQVVSTRMSVK